MNKKIIFSLLIIGLPLFPILFSAITNFTDIKYPIIGLAFYLNPVVFTMMIFLDFIIVDNFQNIDSDHIIYFVFFVIFNLIFWIPVALLINRYLEKRYK